MPDLTAGDLCATHLGATLTLTATVDLDGGTETFTGPLRRVLHMPGETMIVASWSGTLPPSHPVIINEGGE